MAWGSINEPALRLNVWQVFPDGLGNMFYTLQVSRAIAALLVVLFHASAILAKEKYFGPAAYDLVKWFWFGGQAGVAFFFVLSGFIISHVHWRDLGQSDKLLGYLRKRVVRIYPAYILIFLAVYVSGLMVPAISETMPKDPVVLAKSLLLVPQDKDVVGGMGAPVLIVAWSLQYEMVFYLVFAMGLLKARLMAVALIGYGAILLLKMCGSEYGFPLDFLSSHLVLLFVMGVVTARLVNYFPRVRHIGYLLVVLCVFFLLVIMGASANRGDDMKSIFDVSYGLVSAGLIYTVTRCESALNSMSRPKVGMVLGDSSYALYLIHFPLMSVLCKLSMHIFPLSVLGALGAFVLIVVCSVVAGLIFHLYVEKSLINFLMGRRTHALNPVVS